MFPYDGKIFEFEAGEDLDNNRIYILDRNTQKIVNPEKREDWIRNEAVLVLNVSVKGSDEFRIKKGTPCRCWRVWIQF